MIKVCYLVDWLNLEDDFDLYENEDRTNEILKTISNSEQCKSGVEANICMNFRGNEMKDHYHFWDSSAETNFDILCLGQKHLLSRDFDITEYENLLKEYDLLYNEDKTFYLMSSKCAKELINNQNHESLEEAFLSLSTDFRQETIKGV